MKEQALWIYQRFTRANRAALRKSLQQDHALPVAVLFYHRVADEHPNPWTISRANFAHHLDWLERSFDIIDLREVQACIDNGSDRPKVAISFDDGYGDNADYAIPELVRRGLPATYFVSTNFIESGRAFPHDLEAGTELRPNTIHEIREFSEHGISIGAHTLSHCDLGTVTSPKTAHSEIIGSAQKIEDWIGSSVDYFAFPFGQPENTSQLAFDVIRMHGFRGCCTAYGAWNWPAESPYRPTCASSFHIRRIHADPGIERLRNWLTLDSRKLTEQYTLPFSETEHHQNAGPYAGSLLAR